MELTQAKLKEYFNETSPMSPTEDAVELISQKGKFSLKDVVVVEDCKKVKENYEGFLKNLGSVITANFIRKDRMLTRRVMDVKEPIVDIIPVQPQKEINLEQEQVENTEKSQDYNSIQDSPVEPTKPISFDCVNCYSKFTTKRQLTRHIITQHRKYICNKCGHSANGQYSLNKHKRLQHSQKIYPCELCSKGFTTPSNLRQHQVLHTNERLHLCPICGKNFNYANALKFHLRTHTGEKNYLCTYCPKVFSMQCALTRHIRTHTGLRPYKCRYCHKAFRSKGELCCHEYTHTGVRPYTCKICHKGFIKSHNLKLHMLGHDGPYTCDYCGRGFVEEACLKFHMKNAHKTAEDFDIDEDLQDTFGQDIDDAFIENAERILLDSEDSLIYSTNI